MPTPAARAVSRVHDSLPIFRLDRAHDTIFYTPGRVEHVARADAALVQAGLDGSATSPSAAALGRQIAESGREAVLAWERLATKPFEPECLTIYLSNRCNLGCSYCFAAPSEPSRATQRLHLVRGDEVAGSFPVISEDAVAAAARVVARHCARQSKPLTLVLHGGGEPTLHWELLTHIREMVSGIATEHGIESWAYIATHGALPPERARWLARHFNVIGLSCDGPPDIQNANRPFASGAETADLVRRTAAIFREEGIPFTVRATITPAMVGRLRDVVHYAHSSLGSRSVRFEPAYDARRGAGGFEPDDAERFVEGFLEARALAEELGCDLQVSGIRPDEIHGPYCNPLRDVLHVTPDGTGTACFLSTGDGDPADAELSLGHFDVTRGEFFVNDERAAALRLRAARIPSRCESCMNVYHCARDCPDVCVITAHESEERQEGFRCRVHQLLAFHWLCREKE